MAYRIPEGRTVSLFGTISELICEVSVSIPRTILLMLITNISGLERHAYGPHRYPPCIVASQDSDHVVARFRDTWRSMRSSSSMHCVLSGLFLYSQMPDDRTSAVQAGQAKGDRTFNMVRRALGTASVAWLENNGR
jgi:hypothetical protein